MAVPYEKLIKGKRKKAQCASAFSRTSRFYKIDIFLYKEEAVWNVKGIRKIPAWKYLSIVEAAFHGLCCLKSLNMSLTVPPKHFLGLASVTVRI